MKTTKSILVATILLAMTFTAKAQITLEHVYDSAATGAGQLWCSQTFSQLMIINFAVSGERYVKVNRCGKVIEIYDMTHTLVKTISLVSLPAGSSYGWLGEILYLTQQLFSTDSKIGFMYIYDFTDSLGNGKYVTNIYNEDPTLIFSDTSAAMVHPNWEMQQWPISNTADGTKMILSDQYSGKAKVFSLPGRLSTCCSLAENVEMIQAQRAQMNIYPNPNNGSVTLQYELPQGEKEGELILYNMQGLVVKRYKVNDTLKNLQLDNPQLSAGTYFYQLQTSKGEAGSKKMIVIK